MLFKKNPSAMPELISFAFFADSINPDPSEICNHANRLLKAGDLFSQGHAHVLEHQDDQIDFMVGGSFGCIFQRMPTDFPQEKIDPEDPNGHRVTESKEHWGLIAVSEDHPVKRLNDMIKLSIMMQALSMTHRVRAFMTSPLGVVFRSSEWGAVIKTLLNEKVVPLRYWVGYDYREDAGITDAASIYMDEIFGLPNIEVLGSARSPDETLDLLECGVIESIMRGPLHRSTKLWETKTGVCYRVGYARSMYDPHRKATQLTEIC